MTNDTLPDALVRREILYGHHPKRRTDFAGLGDAYREAGRRTDALDAYEKIEEPATREVKVDAVRAEAVTEGDAFNLFRIHRSRPLTPEQWARALEAAEKHGKLRYALRIAKHVADASAVERLEKALGLFVEPEPAGEDGPTAIEAVTPAAAAAAAASEASESKKSESEGDGASAAAEGSDSEDAAAASDEEPQESDGAWRPPASD